MTVRPRAGSGVTLGMASRALALTQGDPAGIGPEVALRAWLARLETGLPPFFLLSDPDFIVERARFLGLDVPVQVVEPARAAAVFQQALPVVPLTEAVVAEPGRPDTATAGGTIEAIRRAVSFVADDEAVAVVTNPIAKQVLYRAGFAYPGHTEYLGHLAVGLTSQPQHPVMMLWSETLAVVPVTVHIALDAVSSTLTSEAIVTTTRIVTRDLQQRFGIVRPRLAMCGLNPHAGESGTMGREEVDVIEPALARLRDEGIDVVGPFPADTMFHDRVRRTYDAAIAMYHDQALLPIKTLAFDDAVNVTLGLPFVRTSPDHGTAFDIAALGIARPDSLIAALRLAARLAASGARAEVAASR